MKKILCISIGILATVVLSVSCNKVVTDTPNDKTSVSDESKIVTITATLSDAMTKVNFSLDETTSPISMKLTWQEGDKLTVSSATNDTQEFTLDSSYDGLTEGRFTGTLPSGGAPYSIVVVPKGSNPSDYTAQTQTANGTTDHLRYIASAEEVNDLSGTINLTVSSGVFGIIAQLPNDAAKSIKSLTLEASSNIFYNNSNELTITLGTLDTANSDNILKFYATIPAASSIPANTTLFLRFNAPETAHTVYTRFYEFSTEKALNVGQFNYLKINCSKTDLYAGPTSSDGTTAAKAYLIADKYQLLAVDGLMAAGATKYFKLVDNINMTGETWAPFNPDPYTKAINLDGNGKTISYLNSPLFDDFNGTAVNLTLDHSDINILGAASQYRGIFANTIKTAASTVSNVDISNSDLIIDSPTSTDYDGGLIGVIVQQAEANPMVTLSGVDIINTNINGGLIGGIVGFSRANVTMNNCHFIGNATSEEEATRGIITAGYMYCGGLVGATETSTTTKLTSISGCTVKKAKIISTFNRVGGAVGHIRGGSSIENSQVGEEAIPVIVSSPTNSESVGGFIGICDGAAVTVENCYAYASVNAVVRYIGGFAGSIGNGTFTECSSYGTVNPSGHTAGGFVGRLTGGSITGSNAHSSINNSTGNNTGGFVGQMTGGTITSSGSDGAVTSSGQRIGGFVGELITGGSILGCSHTTGKVTGTNISGIVGGFAGSLAAGTVSDNNGTGCSVSNCIVEGKTAVGGFVGSYSSSSTASISKCSSSATVEATADDGYAGGFTGDCTKAPGTGVGVNGGSVTAKGYAGGFAAKVTEAVALSGITVQSCNVTSSASYAGGFAAEVSAAASFDDCTVQDMTVKYSGSTDDIYVGGAFGYFHNADASAGQTTANHVTNVTVVGYNCAGGFIGKLDGGTITHNIVTGTLNAHNIIGGFAGQIASGTLSNNSTSMNIADGTADSNKPETNVGGFVGYATGGTFNAGNVSKGTVTAKGSYIGGFVGRSAGAVSYTGCKYQGTSVSCTNAGANSVEVDMGGFCGGIGEAFTGTISGCEVRHSSNNQITINSGNHSWVGGFIGKVGANSSSNSGSITKCKVHNTTTSGARYIGGFVGVSYSTISECLVTGAANSLVTINASYGGGGFIGYLKFKTVDNCYTTAKIKSGNQTKVGGFAGVVINGAKIRYCFKSGAIDWTNSSSLTNRGLFVGYNESGSEIVKSIAWIDATNGVGQFAGVDAGTQTSCYKKATGTYTSCRLAAIGLGDWSEEIWKLTQGGFAGDYPLLLWHDPIG